MNAYDIIRRPVITEQSMEAVADKKYVFMVDVNANKTQIKEAVELAFGVKVAKVNTVRMQGKVKRTGAYPAGRRAAYKKAVITLTADHVELLIILALVLLAIRSQRKYGAAVACGLVLDLVSCNLLLKPLVGRIRPFAVNAAV